MPRGKQIVEDAFVFDNIEDIKKGQVSRLVKLPLGQQVRLLAEMLERTAADAVSELERLTEMLDAVEEGEQFKVPHEVAWGARVRSVQQTLCDQRAILARWFPKVLSCQLLVPTPGRYSHGYVFDFDA